MTDPDCVELLQWAAPRLRLRWEGFRRVRGQVCKRLHRRLQALGLPGVAAYRARLEADPAEWDVLDALCRNVAFTYFAPPLQREVLAKLVARLAPGGLLAIGAHESLPEGEGGLVRAAGALPLFRKA